MISKTGLMYESPHVFEAHDKIRYNTEDGYPYWTYKWYYETMYEDTMGPFKTKEEAYENFKKFCEKEIKQSKEQEKRFREQEPDIYEQYADKIEESTEDQSCPMIGVSYYFSGWNTMVKFLEMLGLRKKEVKLKINDDKTIEVTLYHKSWEEV